MSPMCSPRVTIGGSSTNIADRYSKAKKAELAQSCERIFSGDFIAEVEVKEAALAWVPEAMRFAAPAVPAESANDEEIAAPDVEEGAVSPAATSDATSEIEEAA
jgi:ParB family chromosome partitioning protein